MGKHKLFSFLWGSALAFAVSFGAVGCLITAFDMAVSLVTVAIWCGAAALLCSLCYSLPLGLLPVSSLALISGFLWQQGALRVSFESLLYRLSRQYDRAYDWGILKFNYLTADDMELQLWLCLCMLGMLMAMCISWAVCRRKTSIPGLALGTVLLSACLVVTDTVPSVPCLFLLLFGAGMLLMTGTVRSQDEQRGNRLCSVLCAPIALALLLLFAMVPQNGYRGTEAPRKLMDAFLENETVAALFGRASEVGTTGSSVDSSTVNLKTVGVRLESKAEIMQVLTDYPARLYLRGRALDSYDGATWSDSGTSTSRLYWPTENDTAAGGEVLITTRYAHRMLYLPYYVRSMDLDGLARGMENTKKLTQYSFSCSAPLSEGSTELIMAASTQEDLDEYLHLSKDVQKWAEPLVQQITQGKSGVYEKALAIRDYVRGSAKYSTNTYRMPSGSSDFVKWFLEDSDTGYCVHFASAATVLLQAAGIPARYVTGYTVEARSAYPTVVRAEDAHAWAEYWLPGYGWVVLEATPAAEEEAPTVSSTAPATEPSRTEPSETTQPATEPTQKPPAKTPGTQAFRMPVILWVLIGVLVPVGVLGLRRHICLRLRHKRLHTGTANQRALACWQELTNLSRYLGQLPDEVLFDLAQKAKFSQHTITREELTQFRTAIREAETALNQKTIFHRAYYQIILVLY